MKNKRFFSILLVILIALMGFTGCGTNTEVSKDFNTYITDMCNSPDYESFSTADVPKAQVVFDDQNQLLRFVEYQGLELPYPEDYFNKLPVQINSEMITELPVPLSTKKIFDSSKAKVITMINSMNYISNEDKENVISMINSLKLKYGKFSNDLRDGGISIAEAINDEEIHINADAKESLINEETIVHEIIHTVAYLLGNQRVEASFMDGGIFPETITEILTYAAIGKTIKPSDSIYAEYCGPTLAYIKAVGTENAIKAYFYGNYEDYEFFNNVKALYICSLAWFKLKQNNIDIYANMALDAIMLSLANLKN